MAPDPHELDRDPKPCLPDAVGEEKAVAGEEPHLGHHLGKHRPPPLPTAVVIAGVHTHVAVVIIAAAVVVVEIDVIAGGAVLPAVFRIRIE